jgi:hypothetical protein
MSNGDTMRDARSLTKLVGRCLTMGMLVMAGLGCEPVDDGASTRAKGWDGVLTDNVLDGDRPVYNTIDEDLNDVSASGCVKTTNDAHQILKDNCATCHGNPATAVGLPPWDFVLNDDKMMTEKWTREGQPAIPFIDAGHPNNSAIFLRAAVKRDMPPVQGSLDQPYYDRVTLSGASVLEEWITNCL